MTDLEKLAKQINNTDRWFGDTDVIWDFLEVMAEKIDELTDRIAAIEKGGKG